MLNPVCDAFIIKHDTKKYGNLKINHINIKNFAKEAKERAIFKYKFDKNCEIIILGITKLEE
jgi:hypothetical protein